MMLVVTRRHDEQILIGDDIKVTVVRIDGQQVRLGIEAPAGVLILRAELRKIELGAIDCGTRGGTGAVGGQGCATEST